MRNETIRHYKAVHTWTGILCGLFLFVAFYAGALTVFAPSLTRWATPETLPATPLEQVDGLIARAMEQVPLTREQFRIRLDETEGNAAWVSWPKNGPASPRDKVPEVGAVLAADGSLTIVDLPHRELGEFIDTLHRTAGLPVDVELGSMFMGVVSALYFVALVSGLIVLLPSLIKDLFVVRLGKNVKRFWLDAHNLVGLVCLPFHLIIAVTSVVFGLHDEIYAVMNPVTFQGEIRQMFQRESPFSAIKPDAEPAPLLPVTTLLQRVKETAPDFRPYMLEIRQAGTKGASVSVWGNDEQYLAYRTGLAVVNGATGAVVNTDYVPELQGGYGSTVAAFFSLHFGTYGGEPVKWGYLVLGLAGAFVFYSGNLLWIESRRRHEKRSTGPVTQSRSTHVMAALTVGVCLGCVSGVSLAIIAGKLMPMLGDDPLPWQNAAYYAALVLSVGWALVRGAARATVPLLWAAALATGLIPLLALVEVLMPQANGDPGGLVLEAVALVGAILLLWMARASARRLRNGPRDSVWSAA